MKRRILFVDDEINILRGLKRSLRPLREKWDMVFAEGPENALSELKKGRFDVVVSDMRMPGMDGAKFLQKVKKTYPEIARIILSGHSDQEMIMQSVKSAHQYLTKPCEKKILVTAIYRTLSLRKLLKQKPILDILSGIDKMPSLPHLYIQVTNELRSKEASSASVGRIISKDLGMTAKILQLVNSSFFGMPRHISGAQEAVVMLGMEVVKNLVLGIEVFSASSKNAMAIIPVEKIHEHCVKTGGIAKEIATFEKFEAEAVDNAMIASILHDVGKLILVEYFPEQYKQVLSHVKQEQITVVEAEEKVFGVSHALVGSSILRLWGLPDDVVEAIAYHHNPAQNLLTGFDLSGVVHIADQMEHHERYQPGTWETLYGVDQAYLEKYELLDKIALWRDYLRSQNKQRP